MTLSKSELREKLEEILTNHDVEAADEIADSVVEALDEDGAFDPDEN